MRTGIFILFFLLCSLNYFYSVDFTESNEFHNEDSELIILLPNIENIDFSLNAIEQDSEDKQRKRPMLSFNNIQNKKACSNHYICNVFVITQYYNHLLNIQIDLPPPFIL